MEIKSINKIEYLLTRHLGIARLIPSSNRISCVLFLIDGVVINAAYVLSTGTLLSGYAIYLGASDFITGLINNSSNFSTILSILSFFIFERLQRKKKTLLIMNFVSRFFISLIIVLPLLSDSPGMAIPVLCILVIFSDVLWGIYRVGWLVWMMDNVAEDYRSSYIYLRTLMIRIVMSAVSLIAGFILDYYDKGYMGFFIIISASFILSIFDIFILNKIGEEPDIPIKKNRINLRKFFEPFSSIKYRNFLIFSFFIYFFYTLSTAFTPVYLVKYLGFNYKTISIANVLSIVVMLITGIFWRRLENKKGTGYAVRSVVWVIAAELLVLSMVSRTTPFLIYAFPILTGAGMGGFAVFVMSVRYNLMPENGKTIYEGWFFFSYGLGMLLATFAGGALLEVLAGMEARVPSISRFQLLYLVSFAALLVIGVVKLVSALKQRS